VNYIISANHENDKKIAQINSNLFKNEYFLYDKGISPKKINEESNEELRKYLLQIQFKKENNFKIGYIFIPKESYIKNKYYNKDKNKKDKLSTFKINDEIILYKTEMPEFDFLKKYYVYTFSSRVKEKSEHNFRIIDKNSNKILLECGKISNNSFSMDFSAPFSPLEAFGICISYLN
jgi:tubby-related protein 1